jgi:hypothetical protein
MSMRVWVHNRVSNHTEIASLLPGGIHSAGSLDTVPNRKPFMATRAANEAPELTDDNLAIAAAQQFTFWVHDQPGNYENIDEVIEQLRLFLSSAPNESLDPAKFGAKAFIRAEWLFTSDDLRDDEMDTVVKFVQWRIVYVPQEGT